MISRKLIAGAFLIPASLLFAAPLFAEIAWISKSYDFGLMKEAAGPKSGSARFVNLGPETVSITGAMPSCGCTSVDYTHDPIAPGDTAVVSFTYDPLGRPGKFRKSIKVYVGDHDTYRIHISGNVLGSPESLDKFYPVEAGPLRLSENLVAYGDMVHGKAYNFFVNAYNQSQDSITPSWSSPSKALSVTLSDKKLGPGDIATFSFYFNSGLLKDVGPAEFPVTITADSSSADPAVCDVVFKVNVTPDFSRLSPGDVEKAPRCELAPPMADLGMLSSGVKEFSFMIRNNGQRKMTILRILPHSEAIKIKRRPDTVKSGKAGEAKASLDLSALPQGPFNIKIDIATDDPLHPVRTLSVVGQKE